MRFAIFVAVVAAHIVLLWLFPSLRRLVLLPAADEPAITPVFLPPLAEPMVGPPLEPAEQVSWEAPLRYRSALAPADRAVRSEPPQQHVVREAERATKESRPAVATSSPDAQLSPLQGPPSSAPDWRAQAEVTAQTNALHLVEAEDNSARQAAALTAHFKPLPGPRVRGPEFGWDYAATHRITHAQGGGFVVALNDRCAIFIFLLPMIGCSIGPQPPANGDLFKYMHKPVKFGDWDWRLDDP
jgi:hypothetical protein